MDLKAPQIIRKKSFLHSHATMQILMNPRFTAPRT